MPLIFIRRRADKVDDKTVNTITALLQHIAANALSCKEGGLLKPEDIMFEVDDVGPLDRNVKDINIRVLAHDYEERRGKNLDDIRKIISREVVSHLPEGVSWYVWPGILPTSYGSDTEEK